MKYRQSYWEAELYNQTYDLIVVGAGLTGQSTAHFYKKEYPNTQVLVVDRGVFPIGASTRNAGFACIGTVGEHLADLEIDSEAKLKERIKDRFEGLQLLKSTLGEKAIDYQETGGWELVLDKKIFEKLSRHIHRFNGWMEELIGEKDLYEAGSYNGIPSIYNRCEGMLHPGKMIKRLYQLNRDLGIEYRWNTQISSIEPESGILVIDELLSYEAENLVIATNAFTNQLLPDKSITPGRGYIFVTNELESLEWRGTFHYNKGYVYFRNLGEKRLLIGGGRDIDPKGEETDEFGVNGDVKGFLLYFAEEVLGLPDGWKVEQEWSGIMGFTESKSPVFEKINENCLVVAGLSGMGVALGMQLGKKAASEV
ncbi:MAG: FAD-binding oxidoreductase [Balneolaceae bacterium]|nr:FAD-binding oxidoreductase [Balneolaceae bacterium]MBO6544952.1 FAD-binding oxidoreductase [Balneolaceae bacterium]MBO6646348.1 FAD-binding oxidoreductase [Balneolaceae bacterium]